MSAYVDTKNNKSLKLDAILNDLALLQVGDVVLHEGKSFYASLIRRCQKRCGFTDNELIWTHCELFTGYNKWDNTYDVIRAEFPKVHVADLYNDIIAGTHIIVLRKLSDDKTRFSRTLWCATNNNTRYDIFGVLYFLKALQKEVDRNIFQKDSSWFCSELVYNSFYKNDEILFDTLEPSQAMPAHMPKAYKDGKLKFVAEFNG